jgi:hypothetical protein
MKKPGCPGKESNGDFHVGKWLEWRAQSGGAGKAEKDEDLSWTERKNRAEALKRERDLAKERGELMDREEVNEIYVATWAPLFSYLENGAGSLASLVEKRSAMDAEKIIEKFFFKILRQVALSEAPKDVVDAMKKMLDDSKLSA